MSNPFNGISTDLPNPKRDKVITSLSLDPEVLRRFKMLSKERGYNISPAVNELMKLAIENWESK